MVFIEALGGRGKSSNIKFEDRSGERLRVSSNWTSVGQILRDRRNSFSSGLSSESSAYRKESRVIFQHQNMDIEW